MDDDAKALDKRPGREAQRRYEQSPQGRQTNRERQARFQQQLREAADRMRDVEQALAMERAQRNREPLGLNKATPVPDIAALLWSALGKKRALKVARLLAERCGYEMQESGAEKAKRRE
jgi:hypothetical protein